MRWFGNVLDAQLLFFIRRIEPTDVDFVFAKKRQVASA